MVNTYVIQKVIKISLYEMNITSIFSKFNLRFREYFKFCEKKSKNN
jgi:hypothetical protein